MNRSPVHTGATLTAMTPIYENVAALAIVVVLVFLLVKGR